MTLKDNGNKKPSKKGKYIKCPYCNKKNYIDHLKEFGYMEKYKDVTIIICMECDQEFQG